MNGKYKYAELRGAIKAKFGTQQAFASALKISPAALSSKLNGRTEWSYNEVAAACQALGIALADAPVYFFS